MAAELAQDHPYLLEGGQLHVDGWNSGMEPVDGARRILHVLPKMLVARDELMLLANIRRPQVSLRVEIHTRLNDPVNRTDLVVRRAVPNPRYFVGGTVNMRYGWFVPLDDNTSRVDMTLWWHVAEGARQSNHVVRHDLQLDLLPGPFKTYTMDSLSWGRGSFLDGDTPLERSLHARIYGRHFSAKRKVEFLPVVLPDSTENEVSKPKWKPCVAFREFARLPAVPLSDLIGIRSFG